VGSYFVVEIPPTENRKPDPATAACSEIQNTNN